MSARDNLGPAQAAVPNETGETPGKRPASKKKPNRNGGVQRAAEVPARRPRRLGQQPGEGAATAGTEPAGGTVVPLPRGIAEAPRYGRPLRHGYCIDEQRHGIFRLRGDDSKPRWDRLTDAAVRVTAAYYADEQDPYPRDGCRPLSTQEGAAHIDMYDLRVTPEGREPVDLYGVKVDDFDTLKFFRRAGSGLDSVMFRAGRESKAEIAQAIRAHSAPNGGRIPERPAYTRLGWHLRENASGQPEMFYVHAGGAIGADGPRADVVVRTGPGTNRYRLPEAPADQEAGRAAVLASLALFDIAPPRVAAPMLGAAFRTAMGHANASLTFLAVNQSGKSGVLAFACQHFAPSVRWNNFATPGAEQENIKAAGLEWLAHAVGDMILALDDISADHSADAQRKQFSQMVRMLFNRTFRFRMNRDRTPGDVRPPRCTGVLTAEGVTAQESAENRTHVLSLQPGEVNIEALKAADADGGPKRRAAAMAGFIHWWASKMPADDKIATRRHGAGSYLRAAVPEARPRYLEDVADGFLAGGWAFVDYAREAGYLSEEEAGWWAQRFADGLVESLRFQHERADGRGDAQRATDLLFASLATKACHATAKRTGGAPEEADRWGWDAAGHPSGPMVGWVSDDGRTLYAEPQATTRFLIQRSAEIGEPLNRTTRALSEHLAAERLISIQEERNGNRVRKRNGTTIKVAKTTRKVWDLTALGLDPPCRACGDAVPGYLPGDAAWTVAGVGPYHPGCTPDTGGHAEAVAPQLLPPLAPSARPLPTLRQPVECSDADADGEEGGGCAVEPKVARALVATTDSLITQDGCVPWPATGGLPALLDAAVATTTNVPGAVHQVVIGRAAAAKLRIPTQVPASWHGNSQNSASPPVVPAGIAALSKAGWRGLRRDGHLPAIPWMRLQRDGVRVDVIFAYWHPGSPLITDDDTPPGVQVTRLEDFAQRVGVAARTPGATALELMRTFIERHARRWPLWVAGDVGPNRWADDVLAACDRGLLDWTRDPEPGEEVAYRHTYDANLAYLPAYRTPLAVDNLTHTGRILFSVRRAGLWLVRLPAWNLPRMPAPWACYGAPNPSRRMWLPTQVAALIGEACGNVEVVDSWTADGRELSGMREFSDRLRDTLAQAKADPACDPAVYAAIKGLVRAGYGAVKSASLRIHRPDWHLAIPAHAWATQWRKVYQAYQQTGRGPLAIHVDALTYGSNDSDPMRACPPLRGHAPAIGAGLGQYKVVQKG